MTAPAFLGRRRRRGGVFNPLQLFANGEAGAWYDPGDLTAEKVAWRRNLLTWSEDFTNAAWIKSNATITGNASIAPDGTTTADTFVESVDGVPTAHFVYQQPSFVAGQPYTYTLYAKAIASDRLLQIYAQSSGVFARASFNLNTGSVVSNDAGTAAITAVGSGWYRLTVSGTPTTTGSGFVFIVSKNSSNLDYTGNGSQVASIWGAMLNSGTVAESYQRITDFTSDFLAAFPTHALYQDSAGTTPVTVLGQPVGLALDKSRGALASIGPEIITNGDFSGGTTGWTAGNSATLSVVGGQLSVVNGATALGQARQSYTTVVGRMYRLSVEFVSVAASRGSVFVGTFAGDNSLFSSSPMTSSRLVTGFFTATGTTTHIALGNADNTAALEVRFDNVSVREVPGVHAIQPTSASRPALDARVNLLTYSEQLDNAAWVNNGATVTANVVVAPDGTTTADRIVTNGTAINQGVYQSAAAVNGRNAVFTIWLRGNVGGEEVVIGDASSRAAHTLTTEWQQYTNPAHVILSNFQVVYAKDNTAVTFFAWGADLRLATDAAYPYQRVVTATDYADVGVPRWFLHDGVDDSLYTATSLNLSGTDKVTVWAGVFKNSDAATGVVAELSAISSTTAGVFCLFAPVNPAADFRFRSGGSPGGGHIDVTSGSVPAPVARVASGVGNISAPEVTLRLNGVQAATDSASQGTGNYGNHVVYIGRRNNASLPFNGKLGPIIARGVLTDNTLMAQTERWLGTQIGQQVTSTFPAPPAPITGNALQFNDPLNSGHIITTGL